MLFVRMVLCCDVIGELLYPIIPRICLHRQKHAALLRNFALFRYVYN